MEYVLYLGVWALLSLASLFILSGFFYHAVDTKTAVKRVLRGVKLNNIYFQQHVAILAVSAVWMFFLPGLILAAALRLEGLAGSTRGWIALCLLNTPWWAFLVWVL